MISEIPLTKGRCFPKACAFVDDIVSGLALSTKKRLRETERHWQKLGVNVWSTLWTGARGGAAMASACLIQLAETQRPFWPWKPAGRGLLVEAFPAAQLRYWKLPHQKYIGKAEGARSKRQQIRGFLSKLIQMDATKSQTMDDSADALDAVLCAFAAFAVTTGKAFTSPALLPLAEGRIAVHDSLGADAEYTVS